ncbi:T9SS type A sorting domain-containing protein [Chryseobacterium sp. 2TAF14]|uniref:T9SS type A sorting domain-containing protein n=1 Tax=Chryseobacterium sp. 2TAF14 TaxID=3233007 RepID=UPI003F93E884
MTLKSIFFTLLISLFGFGITSAQNSILVVSSASAAKRVLLLNLADGTVINPNFIDLTSQATGTIKGITQVNDKIWITDQTNDKIYIYNLAGVYESSITTGLDNVRGINVVNNEVWVANDGNGNGSTADSIIRYTTSGTFIGTYPAPNTSIFDILDNKNGVVYVSGLDTNGIQKLNYSGASLGNLVAPGVFQNLQQINFLANGNIVAAVFQNHSGSGNNAGVYVLSPTNGSIINYYPVGTGNLRGVIEAGNGNILYTTGSAVFSINTTTGVQTQMVTGQFQYMTKAMIPSLGVNETKKQPIINVYPNPVVDVLAIESNEDVENIKVFASDGKLVKNLSINSKNYRLKVSDLPTGNYLLMLNSKGSSRSHKFIKK